MQFAIWIVSFFVGVGLAMQDGILVPIGWGVLIVGLWVGYRIGRRKDREKQARMVSDNLRDT